MPPANPTQIVETLTNERLGLRPAKHGGWVLEDRQGRRVGVVQDPAEVPDAVAAWKDRHQQGRAKDALRLIDQVFERGRYIRPRMVGSGEERRMVWDVHELDGTAIAEGLDEVMAALEAAAR